MYLYAMTALAHAQKNDAALSAVLQGNFRTATRLAQRHTEDGCRQDDPAAFMHRATWCGDLQLAQDQVEDAEASYRRALRGAADVERGQTRVASCRNAGFTSLHLRRFGAAAASFQRVVADPAATAASRIEALCGLAAAQHGMGDATAAQLTLVSAARQAHATDSDELAMLTDLWSIDLAVQLSVRAHAALFDHVFWRSPAARGAQATTHADLMAMIDTCGRQHGAQPLIAQRLAHLQHLLRALAGDRQALRSGTAHVLWLSKAGLLTVERHARLEWTLAALAAKDADLARSMLEPLCASDTARAVRRWDVELCYCRAKLCELQGRTAETMHHYQHYVLESMLCVRSEAQAARVGDAPHAAASPVAAPGAVKDEVEMSLPAKYRRAYRYMLMHLADHGLNIKEIAEQIGLSKRALQAAFKAHLGMTPAEIMRRCRMERIRSDLLGGEAASTAVAEVAARWGVRNRSTLVAAYRKHFDETPEQSLGRRRVAVAP